jgi:hypothetical protein
VLCKRFGDCLLIFDDEYARPHVWMLSLDSFGHEVVTLAQFSTTGVERSRRSSIDGTPAPSPREAEGRVFRVSDRRIHHRP